MVEKKPDLPECPFFRRGEKAKTGEKIYCESPVPGSSLSLYFRIRDDYNMQYNIFCCDHYEKCEVYRMVMASLEDN